MKIGKLIDQTVQLIFLVSQKDASTERAYFEVQSTAHGDVMENIVLRFMDDIDSKSSALLGHVSMMIAVLSIAIASLDLDAFSYAVLLAEVGVYIYISLGCLRCLSILSPEVIIAPEKYIDFAIDEAGLRRAVYTRARTLTAIATSVFLLTMTAHFILHTT